MSRLLFSYTCEHDCVIHMISQVFTYVISLNIVDVHYYAKLLNRTHSIKNYNDRQD